MHGHKCGICLSRSRSENLAPSKPANEDWIAFTSCGHVYHYSCVEQWHRTCNEQGCPSRCPSRNTKREKKPGSRATEPLPYLRLYIDAPNEGDAPSSDAVLPLTPRGKVAREKDKRKGKWKGKGKARAVPDDEEHTASESDGAGAPAAAQDELATLRRQRADALATVREQRGLVAQLRDEVRRLQEAVLQPAPPAPAQGPVAGPSRQVRAPPGQVRPARDGGRSRFFAASRLLSAGGRDNDAEGDDDGVIERRGYGPYGGDSEPRTDEEAGCDECGYEHSGDSDSRELALANARVEIARLRAAAREHDPQAVAALAAQLRAQQTRYGELQAAQAELQARVEVQERRFNEAQNEHDEERVRWREREVKLVDKLEKSGASGEEVISQLSAEIDEKDREILHLRASIDRHSLRADNARKEADAAIADARKDTLAAQTEAQRHTNGMQAKYDAEYEARRRIERANEVMNKRVRKLKAKVKDLQTKRGILPSDSDDEDASAHAPAPSTSASALAGKRSRASVTPEPAAPAPFRINNNSLLLASPTKRAHSRTPMDACDVSREEADDDDELEYADEPSAHIEGAENRPPVASDSDSDVEIVESSFFRRPASSAPARPLGARGSASNVLPPSPAGPSKKRAYGLTTLAEGSGSSAGWRAKKPALAQARSDKYLPDFASGLAGTGPKRSFKRR